MKELDVWRETKQEVKEHPNMVLSFFTDEQIKKEYLNRSTEGLCPSTQLNGGTEMEIKLRNWDLWNLVSEKFNLKDIETGSILVKNNNQTFIFKFHKK